MKMLVASDLHYRLKQFDWLESEAEKYDLIVIAGDLLDISSYLDLNVQIIVIAKYLQRMSQKTQLLVCSGNHDGNQKNEADEFIAPWLQGLRSQQLFVDGDNVFFGQTLISIFPWWDGEVTKQAVAKQFEQASLLQRDRWIWIYHAPPDNSPTSWSGKKFLGDVELNRWLDLYRPDMVFTGHIHVSPFKPEGKWIDRIGSTWVFNAGSYIADVPPHIILDLDAMLAEWNSLFAIEEYSLSGAN